MPITGPPSAANVRHGIHHRREPRDGAGAQVIAVREPARAESRRRHHEDPSLYARRNPPPGRARPSPRDTRRGRSWIRERRRPRIMFHSLCQLAPRCDNSQSPDSRAACQPLPTPSIALCRSNRRRARARSTFPAGHPRPAVPQRVQRVNDRLPLRVEHRRLQGDEYARAHQDTPSGDRAL